MKYKILSHLFYEDNESYNRIYEKRFSSDSTIHLDFDIKGNQAFYCLTPEIHKNYISIMELDKGVREVCNSLPRISIVHFEKRSLIDEIVLTNNIEGIHSTRREIDGVLNDIENNRKTKKRFAGLVNTYTLMNNYDIPLKTCQDIRKLYDNLVFEEVKEDDNDNVPDGEIFRKDIAEVTTATQKVIHQGLFPEKKIIEYMDKALKILNDDDIPSIERAAVFHYLFGYIHPFYDGNGRTSRFISSYILSRSIEPLIGYRLSYTIKSDINEYYNAFRVCNDEKSKGDITPFVIMFMDVVKKAMENLLHALIERRDVLISCDKKIKSMGLFEKQESEINYILLQAALFSDEGITRKELAKTMCVGIPTISRKLNKLKEKGYLKSKKISNTGYFKFDIDKLYNK